MRSHWLCVTAAVSTLLAPAPAHATPGTNPPVRPLPATPAPASRPAAQPAAPQAESPAAPPAVSPAAAAALPPAAAPATHRPARPTSAHRPARPVSASLAPSPAPAVVSVRYYFNGPAALADSSGYGHNLALTSSHGGGVRTVAHGRGTAVLFPGKCTAKTCPHVALQAPTAADLNPGTRNFAYGASVLLAPGQTSSGQNVVQKGYSRTSSQWKLQIDGAAGRPSCVLVDVHKPRILKAYSSVSVADGRWHALECRRDGTVLAVYVDRMLRGAVRVPRKLSVSNSRPLSIGGKGSFADNDQFNGALDDVWVRIG